MNLPMRLAAIAAVLHITPAVVLVKRPDAVQALLPRADAYFAREVHLSTSDAHRLHKAVDWGPEDGVLTFYLGRTGSAAVGALEFVRVDTPHGPIEVAVGFTPQGTVRGVLVTKATVEMKPWVLEAVGAGLTNHYRQLKPGDTPNGAAAIAGQAGDLAVYIAGEVDKGVARALAAYGAFYTGSAQGAETRNRPALGPGGFAERLSATAPDRTARPRRPRSRRGSGGRPSARDVPLAERARCSSGTRRSASPSWRDNGRHRGGAERSSSGVGAPRPPSGRRRAQAGPSLSLPPQPRAGPTPAPGTTRRAAACS